MKEILPICLLPILITFASCDSSKQDLETSTISGKELKGEWLRLVGDNLHIYSFKGNGLLFKSIETPKNQANFYWEGLYNIEGKSISSALYDVDFEEYIEEPEWKFISYDDAILTLIERDVTFELKRIEYEIDLELQNKHTISFSEIINDDIESVHSFSYNESIATIDANNIIGKSCGKTYVSVTTENRNYIIRVNVTSKDVDGLIGYYKALGMSYNILLDYVGIPDWKAKQTVGFFTNGNRVYFAYAKPGVDRIFFESITIELNISIKAEEIITYLNNNYYALGEDADGNLKFINPNSTISFWYVPSKHLLQINSIIHRYSPID